MEELSFENILGADVDIETLFEEPEDNPETPEDKEEKEEKEEKKKTTEVDPETLFEGEPESVGSEEEIEGDKEDTTPDEGGGTSPNFYSSIADALAEDGIFPNLSEETVKGAVDAETFSNLIEEEINARFDEKQQRILKALDNGVEPTDIKKYENTLDYIKSIEENSELLAEESEKGEQLRRNLIYQDFLNKGMSPEKAQKFTERTINAGTDIEDAKEALQSNKDYFTQAYNNMLKEAQDKANAEKESRLKQTKELETSILKDKQLIGNIELSQDVRKKAVDAITKPVFRNAETGQYMTAFQKYQAEHPAEFLKYSGLFYALTNGFKDFDSIAKGQVKKEVRKGLKELEQRINNTNRGGNGAIKMVTSVHDDPESYFNNGMKLDL